MKKFFVGLFLSFIWLISFWYCQYSISVWELQDYTFSRWSNQKLNFPSNTNCFYANNSNDLVYIKYNSVELQQLTTWYYCFLDSSLVYYRKINVWTTHANLTFFNWFYSTTCNCTVCEECEECNECPIIDSQYCSDNNLCPSSWTWDCEEWDWNWSALYINNIQHQSAPLINIDIPDYIYWDYSSSEEEFDLYVGSGYDQDYIDNVIAINSYQPTSEDFTDVFVSGLTLVMPYIVIVLFIVFIRKLIKRIFK